MLDARSALAIHTDRPQHQSHFTAYDIDHMIPFLRLGRHDSNIPILCRCQLPAV